MARDEGMFDGPERAVRMADDVGGCVYRRLQQRFHRHDRQGRPFVGLFLIGLGVLFLLDNLNILEAEFVFRNFWPLGLIVFGGYHVIQGPHRASRIIGAVIMIFGLLMLVERVLGWDIDVGELFWPIVLILFGVHLFFNSRRVDAQGWTADAAPATSTPPPIP